MTDIIGSYYPGVSFWHRSDPRVKLFLTLVLAASILIGSAWGLIFLGLVISGLFLSSRLPWRLAGMVVITFKWLLGIMLLANWILPYTLKLSPELWSSLWYSLKLVYRLILVLLVTAWLGYVTRPLQFLEGLVRLGKPLTRIRVPINDLALIVSLSLRFLPELLHSWQEIITAQKLRGIRNGFTIQRVRFWINSTLIPLFIASFRKAAATAVAMTARGYRPGMERSSIYELSLQSSDYLILFGSVALVVVTIISGRI